MKTQNLEEYKAEIREKRRLYMKAWFIKNREKWRKYNREYCRKKRGTTENKWRVK